MNISNLPLNNFYIFCTVLGLLLISAGGGYFRNTEVAHRDAYLKERRNFVELEYLVHKLKIETETLLSTKANDFRQQSKVVEERVKSISNLIRNHAVASEKITFLYEDYRRATFLMYGSIILGIILILFGMFYWYKKTQCFQDSKQLHK